MDSTTQEHFQGLEGFEKLDASDLYLNSEDQFVESGLSYYRQFAVEQLEWDEPSRSMTVLVQGRRNTPYKVLLKVCEGRLLQECECADWQKYGNCKHVVAASAAMFLAVQGHSMGGYDMPEDYAQELRRQLGYSDVGGSGHPDEYLDSEASTQFLLSDIDNQGDLFFIIEGNIPKSFLRTFGIVLESNYGFRLSREFTLINADANLSRFLKEASDAKIRVLTALEGDVREMVMMQRKAFFEIQLDMSEGRVLRRMKFIDQRGDLLEAVNLIPKSNLILLSDGRVFQVMGEEQSLVGDLGPVRMELDTVLFNEQNVSPSISNTINIFKVNGRKRSLFFLEESNVRFELDLTAMENVAGEWEAFEFDLFVNLNGLRVELYELQSIFMSSILHASEGKLLSAKRRVRALCEFFRQVISSEFRDHTDLSNFEINYPELFNANYRSSVLEVHRNLLNALESFGTNFEVTLADCDRGRWLRGHLDFRKVAALLYSFSDASSRADLLALEDGRIDLTHTEYVAEL